MGSEGKEALGVYLIQAVPRKPSRGPRGDTNRPGEDGEAFLQGRCEGSLSLSCPSGRSNAGCAR